jgi:hypothetical protein
MLKETAAGHIMQRSIEPIDIDLGSEKKWFKKRTENSPGVKRDQ